MNFNTFKKFVRGLASPNFYTIHPDIIHGIEGCGTEAGELLDALKRAQFYGTPLDKTNIKEELGDLQWYIALLCDHYGWTQEDIISTNVAKLRARYPEGFSQIAAEVRNLDKEREVLERQE
jgi:NTP pyrophosphatase (non-canonical NTP hydrolase)